MDVYQNQLLDQGYIYLGEEITEYTAVTVCEKIIYLNRCVKELQHIDLIINSNGGSSWSTFAIVNMMEWSKIPINTIGLGIIASGAFVIFIAGNKRILTQTSCILSHRFSSSNHGNYSDLIADRKYEDRLHNTMVNHYMKYTKLKTKKDIEKHLLKDTDVWLTPKEAVKFGIADKVIGEWKVK
jgi:ATP-dependent Clp endopeptidase proteolytic subunit ClpP